MTFPLRCIDGIVQEAEPDGLLIDLAKAVGGQSLPPAAAYCREIATATDYCHALES